MPTKSTDYFKTAKDLLRKFGLDLPEGPIYRGKSMSDEDVEKEHESDAPWKKNVDKGLDSVVGAVKGTIGIDPEIDPKTGTYKNTWGANTNKAAQFLQAGLPFLAATKGKPIFHGAKKSFEHFNPELYDKNDTLGWMTHGAQPARYANSYAEGTMKSTGGGNRANVIPIHAKAENVLDLINPNMDDLSQMVGSLPPHERKRAVNTFKQSKEMSSNAKEDLAKHLERNPLQKSGHLKNSPFDAVRYSDIGEPTFAIPETTKMETPWGTPLNDPPKSIKVHRASESSEAFKNPSKATGVVDVGPSDSSSYLKPATDKGKLKKKATPAGYPYSNEKKSSFELPHSNETPASGPYAGKKIKITNKETGESFSPTIKTKFDEQELEAYQKGKHDFQVDFSEPDWQAAAKEVKQGERAAILSDYDKKQNAWKPESPEHIKNHKDAQTAGYGIGSEVKVHNLEGSENVHFKFKIKNDKDLEELGHYYNSSKHEIEDLTGVKPPGPKTAEESGFKSGDSISVKHKDGYTYTSVLSPQNKAHFEKNLLGNPEYTITKKTPQNKPFRQLEFNADGTQKKSTKFDPAYDSGKSTAMQKQDAVDKYLAGDIDVLEYNKLVLGAESKTTGKSIGEMTDAEFMEHLTKQESDLKKSGLELSPAQKYDNDLLAAKKAKDKKYFEDQDFEGDYSDESTVGKKLPWEQDKPDAPYTGKPINDPDELFHGKYKIGDTVHLKGVNSGKNFDYKINSSYDADAVENGIKYGQHTFQDADAPDFDGDYSGLKEVKSGKVLRGPSYDFGEHGKLNVKQASQKWADGKITENDFENKFGHTNFDLGPDEAYFGKDIGVMSKKEANALVSSGELSWAKYDKAFPNKINYHNDVPTDSLDLSHDKFKMLDKAEDSRAKYKKLSQTDKNYLSGKTEAFKESYLNHTPFPPNEEMYASGVGSPDYYKKIADKKKAIADKYQSSTDKYLEGKSEAFKKTYNDPEGGHGYNLSGEELDELHQHGKAPKEWSSKYTKSKAEVDDDEFTKQMEYLTEPDNGKPYKPGKAELEAQEIHDNQTADYFAEPDDKSEDIFSYLGKDKPGPGNTPSEEETKLNWKKHWEAKANINKPQEPTPLNKPKTLAEHYNQPTEPTDYESLYGKSAFAPPEPTDYGQNVAASYGQSEQPSKILSPDYTPKGYGSVPKGYGESAYKNLGPAGGSHGATILQDAYGKKTVFKPMHHKGEVPAMAEEFGSKIANSINNQTPIVSRVELPKFGHGVQQPFIEDATTIKGMGDIRPEHVKDFTQEHTVDWLIGNHDSHFDQFLSPNKGGPMIPVDKGQSWKHWQDERLHPAYHPNDKYGARPPVYSQMSHMVDYDQAMDQAKHIKDYKSQDVMGLAEEFARLKFGADNPDFGLFMKHMENKLKTLPVDIGKYWMANSPY